MYQETPYNIEEIKNKKVAKFGGSSLSDASQFSKVKNIIELKSESDVVVVSAPGKRNSEDTKVTDSLIDIANLNLETRDLSNLIGKMEIELAEKRSELKSNLNDVKKRFYDIAKELKSETCIDEIDCVFKSIEASVSKEFIVSRG
ncbi:amino acid kinase family protein [Peptoniphilus asaccharolyticus]